MDAMYATVFSNRYYLVELEFTENINDDFRV